MKKSLGSSEWILVASLLVVFLSLLLVSQIKAHRSSNLIVDLPDPFVIVTIDGAVSKPGVYQISSGTSLGIVLKKASPKKYADLKGVDEGLMVDSSLHITIPELTELVVYVEGAVVEPIELHMPLGARISDLKPLLNLTPNADKNFFKKRRLLGNNEKLHIPQKND